MTNQAPRLTYAQCIAIGVFFLFPVVFQFRIAVGQENLASQRKSRHDDQTQLLIEEILREGITQADLELSTPTLQELAAGNINDDEARDRLMRIADGKLVKFLSKHLFRTFFQPADPTDFINSLADRGFQTARLQELRSEINFYFRPQTETQSAQWEFLTNTLFIPVEFAQAGSNKIRTDLEPNEISTIVHEMDHAEKDLHNDILRIRGKSLSGKIHAGMCWGAMLCLLVLIGATLLGNLFRLSRWIPPMRRISHWQVLASPEIALIIVVACTGLGILTSVAYHFIAPTEISDLKKIEHENLLQVETISAIIEADPSQELEEDAAVLVREVTFPWQIRAAVQLGLWGALGGAALGFVMGLLGWGKRLLGDMKIWKWLDYPWTLAITCALIGMIGLGSYAAWQSNRFSKIKAWEISGYYSGYCTQRVLEGERDITFFNTRILYGLSVSDLELLQTLDERGQLKLLLPARMCRMPGGQRSTSENSLAQLTPDFDGDYPRLDTVGRDFEAYLVGKPIDFPYSDHPQIFKTLFETSLALGLDRMALDRKRNEFNYRGLANFIERSELPYYQEIRNRVRQARAKRYQDLLEQRVSQVN